MRKKVYVLQDTCLEVVLDADLVGAEASVDQDWYRGRPYYTVRISPGLQLIAVEELLIHEFAHVINWEEGGVNQAHGDEWGKSYALIYRLWTGDS